jgi:hypothetical protein
MAAQEREELLDLVRQLPEEDVHELLVLARRRGTAKVSSSRRPGWVGILHEGPDFAKRAKTSSAPNWAVTRLGDPGRRRRAQAVVGDNPVAA